MNEMRIHICGCGTICVPRRGFLSQRVDLPVWCYLIEHPAHGLLLVDTGLGTEPLPAQLRHYYRLSAGPPVTEQIRRLGYAPGDLSAVILSDLDIDHTGGLRALGNIRRVLVSEEEYYWTSRSAFARRQPRFLWEDATGLEKYFLRGVSWGPARHAFDFFGDGSVISVLTHGHTFGNCTTLLQWNGKKVLLAGNAVRSGQTLEDDYVFQPDQQRKTVQWFREMQGDPACVGILATHDAGETERTIVL
jgi:glyoxylase-like metal-dependent hydrolase (beta-lactamase superfamily II)